MIPVFQEWNIVRERKQKDEHKNLTFSLAVPKKIGVQLNEARIKKRMTIFQLAELLEKDTYTVALYENGNETPEKDVLFQIQKILDIDFKV